MPAVPDSAPKVPGGAGGHARVPAEAQEHALAEQDPQEEPAEARLILPRAPNWQRDGGGRHLFTHLVVAGRPFRLAARRRGRLQRRLHSDLHPMVYIVTSTMPAALDLDPCGARKAWYQCGHLSEILNCFAPEVSTFLPG